MSASKKTDLLNRKNNASLNDYAILFLCDAYWRSSSVDFNDEDKAEVIAYLGADPNYDIVELIRTMLTNYYSTDSLGEVDVRTTLRNYKIFGYITTAQYNEFIGLLN